MISLRKAGKNNLMFSVMGVVTWPRMV